MKKCTDFIKAVKQVCCNPDLMMAVQKADQLVAFNKSVSKLDQIEISLRDCKFQRAQDMIGQVKDTIFDTIRLGERAGELYPLLSNVINQTN